KSFFIPTYLKLGKLSEDKLLVGLIAVTPQSVQVKYSAKRIQLCAQVVSPEYAHLAKAVLEQIQNKASEVNALLSKSGEIHFENNHVFNADYFEYLQKYSQNTIVFGNLEAFNTGSSPSAFVGLYESLLNEKAELVKTVKSNFQAKIKTSIKASGIEDKADIELKISPDQLAGLYNDMTVSLITKNGSIFAVEAIDFNNGIPALTNSLNAFDVLIGSLNQFSKEHKLKPGTYQILNSIPKSGSEQEKLLNHIFNAKKDLYKVMPEDSIEEITNKIKTGNYQKFSTLL
ncbi:MAG: hypothetical protein Q7J86_15615, partial [Bacteroidota bacterium]|nr:hypothetical protein [Bacteroidota bacterium]